MLRALARCALTAVAVAVAATGPAVAVAAPTVSNTNDSGPGSLRQAIADAAPGDTINVPGGTYTLTSGQLTIGKQLTLAGAGARSTIVSGGGNSRVFLTGNNVGITLSGMTITGGKADVSSLTDCQGGGGICNLGNLTISDSAIVDNVANVNINNQNAQGGGGIFNNGDAITITNSTIARNQANITISGTGIANGGGGYFDNGDGLTITNSTVTGNTATVNGNATSRNGGGGIYLNGAALTVTNVTLASNTTGGAVPTSGGNLFIDNNPASRAPLFKNSIVSGGSAPSGVNCDGFAVSGNVSTASSSGGNVESANTCNFAQANDKRDTDPLLAALADNGGQTDTRALQAGSPALDAAAGCPPPATDQRGVARPQGAGCDSGAFELQPVAVVAPPPPQRVLPKAGCLSIPNVTRDRIAPLRNASVVLQTRQRNDPVNPLGATVRLRGRGAISKATFTVNGKAVAAAANGRSMVVPAARLRIGSKFRNKIVAVVVLRDGRRVRLTQFLVILRCNVPRLACKRLTGGKRLRCQTSTPLAVRRVSVTVTGPNNETARGIALVSRGRYTVIVTSRVALPAGVYIYRHVGTTRKRGERFFMVRLFTVT